MNKDELIINLQHTSEIYDDLGGASLNVAICGGTALNLSGLVERPTRDVDILAPENWPDPFQQAVAITARRFNLKPDWMNPGPVDLLRQGLPEGYFQRCKPLSFGGNLTYLLTSRIDQIFFKLYASIDRGGYHVDDLKTLNPSEDELIQAALWCFTHDVSSEFRMLTVSFLKQMEWNHAAQKLET